MRRTGKKHFFGMESKTARGWRRKLAAALTVCMVATLMPQTAFAVGTGGVDRQIAQKSLGGGINGNDDSLGHGSGTGIATGSAPSQTATDSNAGSDEVRDTTVITSFEEMDRSVRHQEIPKGAKEAAVRLPKTLAASGFIVAEATPSDAMLKPDYIPDEGEVTVKDSLTIEHVTWELTGKNGSPTVYEEGREKNCAYYYRAVLPEGYETVRDVDLPEIEVWYGFSYRNGSDFAGSGTEEDPWRITDYVDLERLAARVDNGEAYESKFFKLDDSFDTGGGALTTSIGGKEYRAEFNGTFDGNGKTIELAISSVREPEGLFGQVGSNGTVKNVIVSGTVTTSFRAGGVAGDNEGIIENCGNISVVVGGSGEYTGGVAGHNGGIIEKCWNSGTVQGSTSGGVTGDNNGQIEDCWNSGTVQGDFFTGGVAGDSMGEIDRCCNIGRVSGSGSHTGGIVGYITSGTSIISQCVSLGVTVSGGAGENVGRITAVEEGSLSDNKARANMLIGSAGSLAVASDAATMTHYGINGEDVTVGIDSLANIFSGWENYGWEIPNVNLEIGCELPTLASGAVDAVKPPEPPTLPGEVMYEKPEMIGNWIFANGTPIILTAGKIEGQPDDAKTVIWLDLDNDGVVTAGVDEIWDPDGDGSLVDTEAGNDLSGKWIYGGSNNAALTGDTKITMLGGRVFSIYGGGRSDSSSAASVSGSTSVMMSGGTAINIYGGGISSSGDVSVGKNSTVTLSGTAKVDNIYGGGICGLGIANVANADIKGSALVSITGSASVGKVYLGGNAGEVEILPSVGPGSALTIGGDVSIGSGQENAGIFLNGGTGTDNITNGVDSFVISHDLTNAVQVVVPKGYSASEDTVIATDAVQGDLDRISLTGAGAAGLFKKYLASDNKIALTRNLTYAVTVDVRKDGAAWTDHGKTFRLTQDAGQSFVTDLTAVKNGTYDVYEGTVDTGADVTVDGSAVTSSPVYYYTVTFYDGDTAYGSGTDWKAQIVLKNGVAAKPPTVPTKHDYTFDRWVTTAAGDVAFDFTNTPITAATKVYAGWTKNPDPEFTVTVSGSYSTQSGSGSYKANDTVTISAGDRADYRFDGWASADGVTFADVESAQTTFIMPDNNVTVTATWQSSGGSTGGSTGGSGGSGNGGGGFTGAGSTAISQSSVTSGQTGASIVVKIDQAAVNAAQAAQTDQAASGKPVQVNVELPADEMMAQLHTADGRPLQVDVEISSSVSGGTSVGASGGPSAGTTGGLSAQVAGIRLPKEVIEAAKASGKDMTVTVKDERGNVHYQWTFRAEDLKNSGTPASDVNLSVHIIPVKGLTGDKQAIRDAAAAGSGTSGAETPGLYLGFDHNGILPAAAQVRIPVGNAAGFRPGDTVWLCWRDPATGQMMNAPENQYTVDEHGFVTIRLDRAYEYVLLPMSAAGAAALPRPSGTAVHVIQKGDTLNKLAERYGCTVAELLAANQIADVYDLRIGQEIVIP